MATTARACGGRSMCTGVLHGERRCVLLCNWRGWRRMSCLAGGCCFTCLPSCIIPQAGVPPPATATLLQIPEITLEQLDAIIPLLEYEVNRLGPSASFSSQGPISQSVNNMLTQWQEQKQICTSLINSLPKELTDEAKTPESLPVAGNDKSLFMSLLTNALSGLVGVHWLAVGFGFIACSLDNINNIIRNRVDCIGILQGSLFLLRNTKETWEATKRQDNATRISENLQYSVEKAFRCAIFCTSNLTDQAWILSILKATTVKDAIAMLADELGEFMRIPIPRQINFDQGHDDDIVGGRDVIKEAVTYLKTHSDDIMAVCLHGMGGIGKSFLALQIFREFQNSKYRDCRVELPFEIKQEDLADIQRQIVEKVLKHSTSKFSNLTDGRWNMEKELKQMNDPIFLYLDNVMEHGYLTDLLPKAEIFPRGSRILITSRGDYISEGLVQLGITHCKLIGVNRLQKQQAQQLLWKGLESQGEHRDKYINSEVESLEQRILELCDGLPLALRVVGAYIHGRGVQNARVWREVVNAMQRDEPVNGEVNDRLYSSVMFSIHSLDPDVRSAFLDIIFLGECSTDYVRPISWENIELLVSHKYLEELCHRALVQKKSDFNSPSTAEIHDVLKAIGKRMIEQDRQELRITGMDKLEEHKNSLKTVVALDHVTVDGTHLLKEMTHLRLLKDVEVRGECQEIQLRHLRVVSGLRCSTIRVFDWSKPASLKVVEWGYPDGGAPSVSDLEVFKHDTLSKGLEVLKLSEWSQLKDVDVIETLTCLKELRLQSCEEIEYLPEGISRLTGLTQLGLHGCSKLNCLPEGISRLKCLKVLDLGICESLRSLPDGLTSLTGLTELNLYDCRSLQRIPESIGNLRGVTHFTLRGCEMLESIPEGATELMRGLTELSLDHCSRIEQLPEGVTRLTGLSRLDLGGCRSLRSLPEGMSALTGLTSLGLSYCRRLRAIPEDIANLTGLTELDLTHCSALQYLSNELLRLSSLSTLKLEGCFAMLGKETLENPNEPE